MSRASTPGSRRASARVRRHEELSNESEKQEDSEQNRDLEREDNGDSQDHKRRRRSRHSEVNYSMSRKYNNMSTAFNGKPSNVKNDKTSGSEVIVRSTKDANYIEDFKKLKNHHKDIENISGSEKLAFLSTKHSLLARELFHLEQYTSLAIWDPEAQPSKYFHDYVEENYNLWEGSDNDIPNGNASKRSSRRGRHSSRIQTLDPLRAQVEEASSKYFKEVFNPSEFYEDEFLITQYKKGKEQLKDGKDRKRSSFIIQPQSSPVKSLVKEEPAAASHSTSKSKQKVQPVKTKRKYTRRVVKQDDQEEEHDEAGNENSEEENEDANGTSDGHGVDADELSEPESESDMESPPPFIEDGHVPKVNLKLSLPKPTILNPDNVPKPEFGSLKGFLDSFKSLDEDISQEEFDQHIDEQRSLLEKIKRAVDNKVITVDDEFSFHKVPPPFPFRNPLLNQHTHHDHLVGQAVHMSKLFENSRKARIQRARKVANMVESHFKRAAGAAERARKEEERRVKTLARNAVQAVKKRWTLAERAYKILKNQEAEELRRIKGKEHLSQMLEHSTQLLEAQMTKQDEGEENNDSDDVDMLSDDNDENNISKYDDEEDANLTVEELKKKYAHLENMAIENSESEKEEEDEKEGDETRVGAGDSNNEAESSLPVPELTEKELEAIKQANEDSDSMLDSDDSLDTDSSSEDESDEESGEEEDEGEPSGLASLFGGVGQGESDDESATYSDDEKDDESDHDDNDEDIKTNNSTPNSSPEAVDKSEAQTEESKKSRTGSAEPSDGVVDVPNPDLLLRGNLRTYQKQGLNWMASLYNNHTNGILADEMGLGKTIQTISLLCYIAVYKEIWGPHLIIVPTSVLLNWEMEFKRFAPGFKVLVYYGSPQQRKEKRKGWNKPDTFHVCITSYQLVCQDQQIFRRKRWRYMILDEAHNIKNFKSNRWNALLNFNTENRLLLTGTPLQNNIMELWSLLYFLMPSSKANQSMPSGFANLDDFQQWFGKPVDKIIEGGDNSEVDEETKKTVHKLHQVLRPYLLRRLKADVEAQMPAKHEHVVYCRLSKRQYKLYHEYLARSDTRETLKNANYISIINALMQLRKVCNHPDLFEERPITTSFAIPEAVSTEYQVTNSVVKKLFHLKDADEKADLSVLNLIFTGIEYELTRHQGASIREGRLQKSLEDQIKVLEESLSSTVDPNYSNIQEFYKYSKRHEKLELLDKLKHTLYLNNLRTDKVPIHGSSFIKMLNVFKPVELEFSEREEFIKPLETRILSMKEEIDRFAFATPSVVTMNMKHLSVTTNLEQELVSNDCLVTNPFHKLQTKLSIQFPDKSLLLYDCGKLQKLAKLLQQLKDGGHRALIFTQMTKVLDVLEQFLNIMGVRYMRLDGATKIEDRQILTERFNSDPKITVFILSTRSGGLGINLTGADTVIFYDSDWNPAMDKQCQDRCHRIGQTRDVHIYRFVSEYTIESNILKKANQKRHLDNVVIQEGEFTTDYFGKLSVQDLVGDEIGDADLLDSKPLFGDSSKIGSVLAQAEDDADAAAAKEAMKEVELDNEEFDDVKSTQAGSASATPGVDTKALTTDGFDDDDNYGHIDEYMIRFIANGYYYE